MQHFTVFFLTFYSLVYSLKTSSDISKEVEKINISNIVIKVCGIFFLFLFNLNFSCLIHIQAFYSFRLDSHNKDFLIPNYSLLTTSHSSLYDTCVLLLHLNNFLPKLTT